MTDNLTPGPMTMIKIDGSKIKSIREAQGLTQLYVATAVQVTTDTISRWENRRYPTIKRENGLKLAESLGVPLDDILEIDGEDNVINSENSIAVLPNDLSKAAPSYGLKKIWPLLLLSGFLLATIFAFLFYYLYSTTAVPFSVKRLLPQHVVAGLPFPVIIHVAGEPSTSTSLIIRETLPPGVTLLSTSPKASIAADNTDEIKWLKKISGKANFAYLVKVDTSNEGNIVFDGTVAIGKESTIPSEIDGDHSSTIGEHHWADVDRDNSISDNEILVVYEQYSDIPNIDLNIDLVEEIWLGSGYRWNAGTSSIEIID